jgi:hypothetical protein
MTSPIVYDFDAIRPCMPSAEPAEETPHPTALAALIAEERRAWDAHLPVSNKADAAFFAWRKANPDLDEQKALPDEIAALYAQAEELEEAANALYERIVAWVPDSLADLIRLLAYADKCADPGSFVPNVLAGLRIIATAGDPVAAATVTGDRRIFGLFRQWAEAFRHTDSLAERASDEVFEEAVDKANRFEDAIAETPAEGIVGLAVKVFFLYRASFTSMPGGRSGGDPCALNAPKGNDIDPVDPEMAVSAIRDIARLVPGLASLCAPALAEEVQP